MERIKPLTLFFILFALSACTAEQIHSSLQNNQKQQCYSAPNSQYDDCMERASESFDEYSIKRKEITD